MYTAKTAELSCSPPLAHMDAVAHDYQLRLALKQHLSPRITADDRLVDEFRLPFGATRADLALVNGHLEAFEIKAGKDNLNRLPAQVEAYNKVFEYSSLVTTKKHLTKVRAAVSRHWGVIVAHADDSGVTLTQVRSAKRNARLDPEHLARLLWREELLAKLEELGRAKGLKSKPKLALYGALAAAMPVGEVADYVRHCLKTRANWRVDAEPRECGGSSHHGAIE
jgi:hypothetical protein